ATRSSDSPLTSRVIGDALDPAAKESIGNHDPHRSDETTEQSAGDDRNQPVDAEQHEYGDRQHEGDREAKPETASEHATPLPNQLPLNGRPRPIHRGPILSSQRQEDFLNCWLRYNSTISPRSFSGYAYDTS